MKRVFILTVAAGAELSIVAEDSGQTWNGYPVPVLTAEQAAIVSAATLDHIEPGPCAGLTWERAPEVRQ
jgi:hypothetical protein